MLMCCFFSDRNKQSRIQRDAHLQKPGQAMTLEIRPVPNDTHNLLTGLHRVKTRSSIDVKPFLWELMLLLISGPFHSEPTRVPTVSAAAEPLLSTARAQEGFGVFQLYWHTVTHPELLETERGIVSSVQHSTSLISEPTKGKINSEFSSIIWLRIRSAQLSHPNIQKPGSRQT